MKKTKVMTTAKDTFELAGEDTEVVDSFHLIGIKHRAWQRLQRRNQQGRIILGRMAMAALDKIWKDKNIKTLTKCGLVKALVFPVALYGSESWKGLERSRMLEMGEGKRERRKPRKRWLDAVKSTTGLTLIETGGQGTGQGGLEVKEVVRGRSQPEDTRWQGDLSIYLSV